MLHEQPVVAFQRNAVFNDFTVGLGIILCFWLFAKYNGEHFIVAIFRVVSVARVDLLRRFLAVLTAVSVLGKVDKGHNVIHFVRTVDFEQEDIYVDAGLVAEQPRGHLDACLQRVVLENAFGEWQILTIAGSPFLPSLPSDS